MLEKWPVIGRHERAAEWLGVWVDLGRAPRTIDAYARGLAEYLLVCERDGIDPIAANRLHVAAFVKELAMRPSRGGRTWSGWTRCRAVERDAAAAAISYVESGRVGDHVCSVRPRTEEIRWVPNWCWRTSGRCWVGTSELRVGCGCGPILGGRRGRSTPMPVGWPSICPCASGRPSTRSPRIGAHVAVYVRELTSRPSRRGANVVSIDSGAGLSNATLQQRLVPVGCFTTSSSRTGCAIPTGRPGALHASRRFGGHQRGLVPPRHIECGPHLRRRA